LGRTVAHTIQSKGYALCRGPLLLTHCHRRSSGCHSVPVRIHYLRIILVCDVGLVADRVKVEVLFHEDLVRTGVREKGQYDSALFRRVLRWSVIFSRYTSVARKETGDRHASQLTTPANTEEWGKWRGLAMDFIMHYVTIGPNSQVTIKDKMTPRRAHKHGMRPKIQILDDGTKKTYVPKE
jgi:hypothetical protein